MSTQLFEGQQQITRGDEMALPRYRRGTDGERGRSRDRVRHTQTEEDVLIPPPSQPAQALSAALARRRLGVPRPQPPTGSLGSLQPRSPRQIAAERAARFGRTGGPPVRHDLDDYAQTGLAAYRPPHAVRNPMGWIEVDGDVGSHSGASLEFASSIAHLHVRFRRSVPRPAGALHDVHCLVSSMSPSRV